MRGHDVFGTLFEVRWQDPWPHDRVRGWSPRMKVLRSILGGLWHIAPAELPRPVGPQRPGNSEGILRRSAIKKGLGGGPEHMSAPITWKMRPAIEGLRHGLD